MIDFIVIARCIKVESLGWINVLHVFLSVPTRIGTIIRINEFSLGTIYKCKEVLETLFTSFNLKKKKDKGEHILPPFGFEPVTS